MIAAANNAARARALVKLWRHLGPAMRRHRIPRQAQPDHIRVAYLRAILPVCEASRAQLERMRHRLLLLLEERRRDLGHHDAGTPWQQAKELLDAAAQNAANAFDPVALKNVALRFGQQTSDHQRAQLDRQVRAATGIPYGAIEKPTRDLMDLWATSNTELIKTVPDRYWDRIAADTQQAFEDGASVDSLVDDWQSDFDISENDARRIARDQIGKLNGELNQTRQESLGITSYVWTTAHDNRVRETHADLDGETFDWDDPPVDDDTGEEITPGSAINCRCQAVPVMDDISDDQGAEESDDIE